MCLVRLCLLALLAASVVYGSPLGKSRHRATHVPPERRKPISSLFVWPNSYYDIPRHRYPYYDKNGKGKLVRKIESSSSSNKSNNNNNNNNRSNSSDGIAAATTIASAAAAVAIKSTVEYEKQQW